MKENLTSSKKSIALLAKWAFIVVLGLCVVLFLKTTSLKPEAATFTGVFIATIAGLILQPAPGEQIVFIGLVVAAVLQLIPVEKALSGYGHPIVWLVLCAVLLSRGMIKTGLGHRLAYLLIRLLGKRTLTLGYALVLSDVVLGSVMPSNGARAGAILFPIVESLATTYDSKPGPTANRLGSYLMSLVYQGDVVVCATFLTGQISNFLIVNFIQQSTGMKIEYGQWILYSFLPAIVALLTLPLFIYKICPPEIKVTPKAPELAQEKLKKMGPMSFKEKMTLGIFVAMAVLWMIGNKYQIHYTLVAMIGIVSMLLSGILEWEDLVKEKNAWSVYIWFGGLITLAGCLENFGVTRALAEFTVAQISGQPWWIAMSFLLMVYFFAHYGFASVTAHVTAMFLPFLSVALASGAPKAIVVLLFAFFSNLCAALTHYGTTPAPIYFGAGYVSQMKWWKIGFLTSVLTILIWSTVGVTWWKILGLW